MRLIARSREITVNLRFDTMERVGDVLTFYRGDNNQFVGMFDLAVMDYLYVSEEREKNDGT